MDGGKEIFAGTGSKMTGQDERTEAQTFTGSASLGGWGIA